MKIICTTKEFAELIRGCEASKERGCMNCVLLGNCAESSTCHIEDAFDFEIMKVSSDG